MITEKEYPWKKDVFWKKRMEAVVKLIPFASAVVDLGGGYSHLEKQIEQKKCRYVSLDIEKWTDKTIKADFNKGEFPDAPFGETIVCQGILEYIEDPLNFLKRIKKYGRILILTYMVGEIRMERKNNFEISELREKIIEAGWEINFDELIQKNERIFECLKND